MGLLGHVVDLSLRNRAVVLVATLVLVVGGLWSARRLPIDAVPDVTTIQVQVVTSAPALSALEVEQYISVPVERAMQGLPDVEEVRSLSKYGMSVVTVVFDDATDIYFARQRVSEQMSEARDDVVGHYGAPQMGPISTGLGEIYQFTVRNEAMNLMELEELLDWYIGPQLRSVPGVVEVNSFGGENREYQVVLDPDQLQALDMSASTVAEALRRSNANAGGGYIERNREHIVIGTEGLVQSREDLEEVVLGTTAEGIPVTVGAVGEVRFGPRLRRGAASMDGEGEVVVGVALMLMGANPREVTQAIKAKITELNPSLPPGTQIEPFYDRSELVDRTIRTAATNLLEGAALVIAVLFLLLGDLRAGLVVAAVIPLSMLGTLVLMKITGVTGNLMSLGAIDFGIIVDGAVIVVENASRRLGQATESPLSPLRRLRIVRDATMEVRRPTVYGELIIAIVYVPIVTLSGVEGKLFRPMASTVLFALGCAFVLSLTLVPVLASLVLRPSRGQHRTWLMRRLDAVYGPVLALVLRRPVRTMLVGMAVVVGGLLLGTRLGTEFVPKLDEGDILLEVRRPPGVALSESVAQDLRIERALLPIPEVEHVVGKTGAPELALDPMGIEQTDVYIDLTPRSQWRAGLIKEELAQEIVEAVEQAVPEIGIAVSQPIEMRTGELVAGVRSDVGIVLYGPDLDELVHYGDAIARQVQDIEGIVDVRAEQTAGLRYLRIIPDRHRLARHGLTIADVNLAAETMSVGHEVGFVLEGDRKFAIRVRVDHPPGGDLQALAATPLHSSLGHMIPLEDVAELKLADGPAAIDREALSRRRIIEFNVRGRDLGSAVAEAQRVLEREGPSLPPGYRVEWGGSFVHYEQARDRLFVVIPAALGGILFLLWLAFRRVRPALLVFIAVPFGTIGGIVALWLRDIPFSISAGVGFIALFGVTVLNALVLVSTSRTFERTDGSPPAEAIGQAARLRLRPVLMTALTDIGGFVPMALSTAPGSEVQRPLATAVIGGLMTASLLTLVLLPAIYAKFGGGRRGAGEPEEEE